MTIGQTQLGTVIAGKPGSGVPRSVLYICGMNSIRSPMASAITKTLFPFQVYSRSAGIKKGQLDPFVGVVMQEVSIDISTHNPHTIMELNDGNFDLMIALAPEARNHLDTLKAELSSDIEYWPLPDPTLETGNRERRLLAYRSVRDTLIQKIKARFEWTPRDPVSDEQ